MTVIRTIVNDSLLSVVLFAILALSACSAAGGYKINYFETDKVVVDGKVYRHDIVIMPDGSVHHLPGNESHLVYYNDIKEFIDVPEIKTLVVGAGTEGKVELDGDLADWLAVKGIKVKMLSTEDAIYLLNQSAKEGVLTVLHLNC